MRLTKAGLVVSAAIALGASVSAAAHAANSAETVYTYDQLGRLMTALTPATGVCIAYSYDATGNRTSETITISGAPESPTWGTGVAGCFLWTPQ